MPSLREIAKQANVDHRRIGERVVDHLRALGHRRFAMIFPDIP